MALKKACDDIFIESTIRLVSQIGIENTRTRDVAEMAGFSEATLFRHFETKEDLLNRTFLYVDEELSNILTKNAYIRQPDNTPFEFALYHIWHQIYRFLLDHPEETIFLIRFRYSSLYTNEIREKREAYNGAFDRAYEVIERALNLAGGTYRGVLVNYIFEVTLCFTEKIINGRIEDNESIEYKIWTSVYTALKTFANMKETDSVAALS